MNLVFKGKNNTDFTLGSVSFNFLDQKGVFDKYQQDNGVNSIVILEVANTDLEDLSKDVKESISREYRLRGDIVEKLRQFSDWVKESKGFQAFIL